MFDYQAGEKYKLTLIMVALAGLMVGIFFTSMLMPTPEPAHQRRRPAYADDPDITGVPRTQDNQAGSASAQPQAEAQAAPVSVAEPVDALNLIQAWLPYAWDLSAGSAKDSQEKAIQYMTAECAAAYRQNIWTPQIAQQIDESCIKSTFAPSKVTAGNNQSDGSIVIFVEGSQVLSVPNKASRTRAVKLEYLIKNTDNGLRIAGISEGGHGG